MGEVDGVNQYAQNDGDLPDNRDAGNDDEREDVPVTVETKLLENSQTKNETKFINNNNYNNYNNDTNNVKSNKKKKGEKSEYDRTMTEDINKLLADMPLTEDVTCGFGILKGTFLQRFANQTAYVILYGLVGSIFGMTYAYFNGTITTIEKRFKIPSKNTGIISVGNDISQMLVSAVLSYYAGKGHRPRWIGFGLLTIVIFCLLTAAPHFLYGPGEDALALTAEFGAVADVNTTLEILEEQKTKSLCRLKGGVQCESGEGNLAPQLVLFAAQFISGIGGSLYYTLGVAYMDDNTKKSKTPALLSLSYFLRMLGPAIGYALSSFCLRVYIAPQFKPVITNSDPRWLGAWWLGWIVLGILLFFSSIFLALFPKDLPRAVARRIVEEDRKKQREAALQEKKTFGKKLNEKPEKDAINVALEKGQERATTEKNEETTETKASFKDMGDTFKRLITNKTYMCNKFSSIFYIFGYMPYWIFTPKYIEIQYRQSAATSSLVTGTVALAFSAIGVLLSGFIISRYKPKARYMVAWNIIVGIFTVIGMFSYAFVGCPGNEKSVIVNIHDSSVSNATTCNSACHCDYVRYSPICGENSMTYISPCHAGCRKQSTASNGKKFFYDCACIPNGNLSITNTPIFDRWTGIDSNTENRTQIDGDDIKFPETSISTSTSSSLTVFNEEEVLIGGQAIPGACPVDCFSQFVTFLAIMCGLKFFGATGRASNFLVSVRCVDEKDKTAAMGLGMMTLSMLALIPSPIFFGWLLDSLCLVWGKTCTNKGNCWLYDPESLRWTLNSTAGTVILISILFDCFVWYFVKDLKIFGEEIKDTELEILHHEEEARSEKNFDI